jgi:hypothetical protein
VSVYVGIDVHRKHSQVAVAGDDGWVQLNRNIVNGSQPMLGLFGGLPTGRQWRSRRPSAVASWVSPSFPRFQPVSLANPLAHGRSWTAADGLQRVPLPSGYGW